MSRIRFILAITACILTMTTSRAVPIRRISGTFLTDYLIQTDRDNPKLWNRQSDISFATKAAPPGAYATNDMSRTGRVEYLLVLADFPDRHFTLRDPVALHNRYERIFNSDEYTDTVYLHGNRYVTTGSVSNYFKSQSYGQFEPVFKIVGPIQVANGYATYGKDKNNSDLAGVERLIKELCDSLTAMGINLSHYDNDGDGNLESFSVIYAGRGQNYEGAEDDAIWPQASTLQLRRYNINNMDFMCTCELCWDSDTVPDGIGTFCHEFSHTLGLPDFYYTNGSLSAAMGYWSLMDYGTYENEGFSPVGYTAFEKYSLGWMDIEEINAPGRYWLSDISIKAHPDADIHTAYRINSENNDEDKFIILENHNKKGWYKYHKTEGLMVTVVSYLKSKWNSNTVNQSASSKHYYILPADNNYSKESCQGDLFPYNGNDSLTPFSSPKLDMTLFKLYSIERQENLVTFSVSDRYTLTGSISDSNPVIECSEGILTVRASIGSHVELYDIAGKKLADIVMDNQFWLYKFPDKGFYIVKCGCITKKVSN